MKRLRHLPIAWGPTPSRVATTALLGSRSQASTIFARNVSAAGSERERVIAKRCTRSSLDIVSNAFGRPVRICCVILTQDAGFLFWNKKHSWWVIQDSLKPRENNHEAYNNSIGRCVGA